MSVKFNIGDKAIWRGKIPVEIVDSHEYDTKRRHVRMDVYIDRSKERDHSWDVKVEELSLPRAEPPVYTLVRKLESQISALLAVADTPSAQDSVCRTIEATSAAFRAGLTINDSEVVSGEDAS